MDLRGIAGVSGILGFVPAGFGPGKRRFCGSRFCSSFLMTGLMAGFVGGMLLLGSGAAMSGEVGPKDVKFAEEGSQVVASLSGVNGNAGTGREVFSDRKLGNCLACHVNSDMKDEHSFHGEVGPSLDGVADRYEAAELRAILVDSKKALNDETIMPGFYSLDLGVRVAGKFKDQTILNAQQVEDVLAYLQTLKEAN